MAASNPQERTPFGLSEGEEWWKDRYDFLIEHGYQLRPRYHPDWKPSWSAQRLPNLREDRHVTYNNRVMDAIRLSDKAQVAIKKLRKGSEELKILRYLDSEQMRKDPRNRTVPILDVFSDEDDTMEFLVMPLLRHFNSPSFNSVDEVTDFIDQTLTGLSFLHSKGVAHRDCSTLNIMMDAKAMFPKGFHAAAPRLNASGKKLAYPRRRRDVKSIAYYFTDFGISSRFEGSTSSRLVIGKDCQDKQLPEIHQDKPYDPFLSDIFILGNLYKHRFVAVYENLAFLSPLADAMTQTEPAERPNIGACLDLFKALVNQRPRQLLRQLLIYRDATNYERFVCRIGTIKRETAATVRSLFLCLFEKHI